MTFEEPGLLGRLENDVRNPLILTRRPYLFALLLLAVITAINLGFLAGATERGGTQPAQVELFAEVTVALLLVAVIVFLRARDWVGLRALRSVKELRLYWIPVVPLFPILGAVAVGLSSMSLADIAVLLLLACLIGFVEEVAFRGLILRALAARGAWRAAVVSAVLFGLMHLQNLAFGADLVATLLQVLYASAMGFGFAAVTLRTGSLWPLIVVHALIDFAAFVTSGGPAQVDLTAADVGVYLLYIATFTGYGIYLMRTHPAVSDSTAQVAPGPSPGQGEPSPALPPRGASGTDNARVGRDGALRRNGRVTPARCGPWPGSRPGPQLRARGRSRPRLPYRATRTRGRRGGRRSSPDLPRRPSRGRCACLSSEPPLSTLPPDLGVRQVVTGMVNRVTDPRRWRRSWRSRPR